MYYLKIQQIAYIIGRGKKYEVLNVDFASNKIHNWVGTETFSNQLVFNIKDANYLILSLV